MYDFYELSIINDKARFYAMQLWGMHLDIPIMFNKRLRSTHAWFTGKNIELGQSYLKMNEIMIDDVILHELCHWYCKKIGKPNNDHDYFFEMELLRIGATSTEKTEWVNGKLIYWNPYRVYQCLKCDSKVSISPFDIIDPHTANWSWQTECCGQLRNTRGIGYSKGEFKPNKKLVKLNQEFRMQYNKLPVSFG